jgi:hypothetical protein
MGKRKRDRQPAMWVTTTDLPTAASHPFYRRLNQLREHGFDDFAEAQCANFYAGTMGRSGLPPGIYFRLLLIGYFEGIDSERGIVWRAADSLALRDFIGGFGELEPLPTQRPSKDPILFHQIREGLPLLASQPAGQDGEHHLDSRHVNHGGSLYHGARSAARVPSTELWDTTGGLVMVIMALDHVHDFFSNARSFDSTDLTQTNAAVFLTRWMTHFCAPVLVFLAETGASLSSSRGKATPDLARFLLSRGVFAGSLAAGLVAAVVLRLGRVRTVVKEQ